MGRVWPRHSHCGRPLNWVVSHHPSNVESEAIIQIAQIGVAITVFIGSFFVGVKPKFRPVEGAWIAVALIGFGALFQYAASLIGDREWLGLGPFLLMQRGTIWHGTTFVAVGYGLLAYSTVRGIGMLRKGDG